MQHYLMLFFMTFVHEDVAIVSGAYFIAQHTISPWLGFLFLYSGVVVSDVCVYGLGYAARENPWAKRYFDNNRASQFRERLEKNLVATLALCRLLPGILFPTFSACGWLGVPFIRFLRISMLASILYVPLMMFLVSWFGKTMLVHWGNGIWMVILGLVIGKSGYGAIRAKFKSPALQTSPTTALHYGIEGMPLLPALKREVGLAEYIPPFLFYAPIVLQWLWLGLRYRSLTLPTVTNPLIPMGGLWGESKSALLQQVTPALQQWIAPFVTLRRSQREMTVAQDFQLLRNKLHAAQLTLPVVVKPDEGWQGYGVRHLDQEQALYDYLVAYPQGHTLMVQQAVPWEGEAGVFYIREPGATHGRVTSLTLRYFPYVIGDGVATVRQLIGRNRRAGFKARQYLGAARLHHGLDRTTLDYVPARAERVRLAFIGSLRVGGLYRDASEWITPALQQRFDAIASSIPEFYFGRFDIRFRDITALQAGEDFAIIEINGAGSEAIHIWDPNTPLRRVYRELFAYQARLFKVAAANRARGYRPLSLREFIRYTRNYDQLLERYPPSM